MSRGEQVQAVTELAEVAREYAQARETEAEGASTREEAQPLEQAARRSFDSFRALAQAAAQMEADGNRIRDLEAQVKKLKGASPQAGERVRKGQRRLYPPPTRRAP